MKLTIDELRKMIEEQVQSAIKAQMKNVKRQYTDNITAPQPAPTVSEGKQLPPGIRMARAAKCIVLAKNDPERAASIAAKMYADDKVLASSMKALAAGTPSEGGFLIPENLSSEVIPLLRAKAIVRKLGARSLPLANGNLTLPKITGGATSYYIGENQNAKKSQQTLGALRLSGKKLVTLVPVSNDLIRNASIEADMMVRDDMLQSMQLKEDYSALFGSGTEFAPLGLSKMKDVNKPNALNALPTSATLADLVGILMTENIPWASVGWGIPGSLWPVFYNLTDGNGAFIHREEMNQGKLLGLPFQISNQIPTGGDSHKTTSLFLGDWSEFIIGEEMTLEFSASTEASYIDESGNSVSAFSMDQTVLKVVAKHDFGARHGEAFLYQTGIYTA